MVSILLTSDVAIVLDSEAVSHSNWSVDSVGAILFKSPRQHDNCESNAINILVNRSVRYIYIEL